jgi:hypothetical protein
LAVPFLITPLADPVFPEGKSIDDFDGKSDEKRKPGFKAVVDDGETSKVLKRHWEKK